MDFSGQCGGSYSNFGTSCGSQSLPPAAAPVAMCFRCGVPRKPGLDFCGQCGAHFSDVGASCGLQSSTLATPPLATCFPNCTEPNGAHFSDVGASCGLQTAPPLATCFRCGVPRKPEMDFCEQCGAPHSDFGASCGSQSLPPAAAPVARCFSCGVPRKPGMDFCGQCGSPHFDFGASCGSQSSTPAVAPVGNFAACGGYSPQCALPNQWQENMVNVKQMQVEAAHGNVNFGPNANQNMAFNAHQVGGYNAVDVQRYFPPAFAHATDILGNALRRDAPGAQPVAPPQIQHRLPPGTPQLDYRQIMASQTPQVQHRELMSSPQVQHCPQLQHLDLISSSQIGHRNISFQEQRERHRSDVGDYGRREPPPSERKRLQLKPRTKPLPEFQRPGQESARKDQNSWPEPGSQAGPEPGSANLEKELRRLFPERDNKDLRRDGNDMPNANRSPEHHTNGRSVQEGKGKQDRSKRPSKSTEQIRPIGETAGRSSVTEKAKRGSKASADVRGAPMKPGLVPVGAANAVQFMNLEVMELPCPLQPGVQKENTVLPERENTVVFNEDPQDTVVRMRSGNLQGPARLERQDSSEQAVFFTMFDDDSDDENAGKD